MSIIIIISIILAIIIIGYFVFFNQIRVTKNDIHFATEYQTKFRELAVYYSDKSKCNEKNYCNVYTWLTKNVTNIQHLIGDFGVFNTYSEPYSQFIHSKYEIIVNTLPKFRSQTVGDQSVSDVDDCLIRFIGYKENQIKQLETKRRNPFKLFVAGIKKIVAIPLWIVLLFGIYDDKTINKAKESFLFNVISLVVSLLMILSTIITVVTGWEQFFNMFKS